MVIISGRQDFLWYQQWKMLTGVNEWFGNNIFFSHWPTYPSCLSPSCRAGWCSFQGSGDQCVRACCPRRRLAATRGASSSPAMSPLVLSSPSISSSSASSFPSTALSWTGLKPVSGVSIFSRLKDHSWSRTWLFVAQEIPSQDSSSARSETIIYSGSKDKERNSDSL